MKRYDEIWSGILSRFGEDNMRQLIDLIRSLDELYEESGR